MATPHIEAKKEDIAKRVLMPGDPNRATHIAQKYLTDVKLVNQVRGELAYTGKYKGVDVTVFSSGMGIGSMGIYSYELYNFYDVDYIIRIGTAGAYLESLDLGTNIVVTSAYSLTNYDEEAGIEDEKIINSSFAINNEIEKVATINQIPIMKGRVHTTEAFYNTYKNYDKFTSKDCLAVEMEAYALFFNAKKLHKQASCICTISDNLITKKEFTSEERVKNVDQMIYLALETIIKL